VTYEYIQSKQQEVPSVTAFYARQESKTVIENVGQNALQAKCTKKTTTAAVSPSLSRYNNRSQTGNFGYKSVQRIKKYCWSLQ